MADFNNLNNQLNTREYDALDKALAARPQLKAPRHTRDRVMARIIAAPQTDLVRAVSNMAARYPAPAVKYAPPVALPLPEPVEAAEVAERSQRRLIWGFIFTGMWLGLCLLAVWAIWPAVSNLIFGPSTDPAMQAHLATIQAVWKSVTGFLADFWSTYGLLLPSLISGAIGLGLMALLIFGPTQRRLRLQ